jgi:putative lipoic acid-binding regulatory protein
MATGRGGFWSLIKVDDPDSVFEFPCRFPIKVMGRDNSGFEAHVVELISASVGAVPTEDVVVRSSSKGTYVAVTVTIEANSREQLDNIYRALTGSELVLYVI